MRKAVIVGGNPYVHACYAKNSQQLLEETGGNTGNLAFRFAVIKGGRISADDPEAYFTFASGESAPQPEDTF